MAVWFFIFFIIVVTLFIEMTYFKHKVSMEEVLAQAAIPIVLCLITYLCFNYYITKDTQILGHYVTSVTYEEEWNEYIYKTCSRDYPCGKDRNGNTEYCTEYYDCSYVQNHPERWTAYFNTGLKRQIEKSYYQRLVKLFKNERKTGHNVGYTISGDVFTSKYNGKREHIQAYSTRGFYTNPIQASVSLFNFEKISHNEAKELGLYRWGFSEGFNTKYVFGGKQNYKLNQLNAKYGSRYEISVIVILFNNKPPSIFEKQKSYWNGGNKNELVIGFGLKEGKVAWTNYFTWSESFSFLTELKRECEKQIGKKIDLDKIADWLYDEIPNGWKRKEFKDFEYLKPKLPKWYQISLVCVCLVSSVIIACINIGNDHENIK